ncbi:MAG: hypothetical protein K2G35_08645 [Duncaniella sp.]|nr:hypothetical protein [Duncaniella sp.]
MPKKKIIMAWSKCAFEIGKTSDDDSMATSLTNIGKIKDKSSTLEPSDGDSLEMKATGGETVAKEAQEGGFKAVTRVIEPTDELLTLLGLGEAATDGDFKVKTHLVDGDWSLKITPKNVGAKGIKAPKTNITYKPGWSEEDGNYADLEFEFLKGEADYWYSRFVKTAATAGS